MSHKVKKNHTQAYVSRTLAVFPTREYFQRLVISLDLLHDNEAREAALNWALPKIGEKIGPWEIRGRVGKDVFLVDGPAYTADGLLNVTVYRMYAVERIR